MNNPSRKRGVSATDENKRNYAALIANMKATGMKFPSNQFGRASIGWVADKIHCTRDVLRSGSLAEQFKKDVALIGVEARKEDIENARMAKRVEDSNRENTALRKRLSEKTASEENYRRQVEILTKKVRELEMCHSEEDAAMQELLESGRRFFL